jgi:copper chaperone CopZ
MNKIFYNVSDIINSECKTQVKNALDKIKGVQKVGISLKSGVVAVDYNEPADENQIKNCIENTGFTVT